MVREELKRRNISEAEVASSAKGAEWEVEIAKRLRKETTAKNPWIASRLKNGASELRRQLGSRIGIFRFCV